eukprot:8215957-Heterocapsa_arctica.AAC.1
MAGQYRAPPRQAEQCSAGQGLAGHGKAGHRPHWQHICNTCGCRGFGPSSLACNCVRCNPLDVA